MRCRGNLWLLVPIVMLALYILAIVTKIDHPQPAFGALPSI